MRAMVLEAPGRLLVERELPPASPGPQEALLRVEACGVCRTDLHIVDGDLAEPRLPLVLGHQIVGRIERLGPGEPRLTVGQRVGVPWLGGTCGRCAFCRRDQENLCDHAVFTGYQRDGGFAEQATADARFCFPLPDDVEPARAAPWLCAGLIGYRALRLAGDAERVGLYGFGSAAHLVAQILAHQGCAFYAFTRPGDLATQRFARTLGARWAGGSDEPSPEELDAALIFAPAGPLVPKALRDLAKGGVVVCGGIHMSDIPAFPYSALWQERVIRSVANLTRRDGEELLALAPRVPLKAQVTLYPLREANRALDDLRRGRLQGSAVLQITG